MKTTIFYFSATGNSLFVARELAKRIDDVSLTPINGYTLGQAHETPNQIGFVFPVYFCGIPILLRDFIRNLEIKPDTTIFSVCTFGGGDYMSHQQIDEELSNKQTRLAYHASIVMPGNYQLMYDTASPEKQLKLFNSCRNIIASIAEDVNMGKVKLLRQRKGVMRKLLDYWYRKSYAISGGRDFNFLSTEVCNHCGLCANVCPVQNIRMQEGRPLWQGKCQLCLACLHWCPTQAVQYRNKTAKRRRYHHPEVVVADVVPKRDVEL